MNSVDHRIRSFVRRPGRLTTGQRKALETLWPKFGIESIDELADWSSLFGRSGVPRLLEIGYGDGESLVALAAAKPEVDVLGLEIHEPGIGHCLLGIEDNDLGNVRLLAADAIDVLESATPPGSLSRINVYFPDPWPKKRHHKRRLLNPSFLTLAARALPTDGTLNVATDWAPYAEHIAEVLGADPRFELLAHCHHLGDEPIDRATTKFERRGLRLGHEIDDWVFRRCED